MDKINNSSKVDIGLNVTRRCNLQCSYCFLKDLVLVDKNTEKDLIPNVDLPIDETLKKLSNYEIGGMYICGGEPFAYPELRSLLDWLIARADNIYISTNGLLINDDWINYLVENDITLLLSLKDSSEATYNRLIRFKNAGIKMHLYHVLTKKSDDILKSFTERYSWVEKVRLLIETHTNPTENDVISVGEWYNLLKKARVYLHNIIDKVDVEIGYLEGENKIAQMPNRGAVNRLIIDVDLKMYPCPLLVERHNGKIEGDLPNSCSKEECPVFFNETSDSSFKQVCPFLLTNLKAAIEYIEHAEIKVEVKLGD
ncbi:MAG: radical SAM protein [Bacteroidales bacterium]|nr:radical SAM protein [Bacteroidales bacterium]